MTPNAEVELLGHKITYEGQTFTEDGTSKFYVYNVDGETVQALTKLRANGEDAAREPAILKKFTGDVYIAPNPANDVEVRELILERKKFTSGEDYGYLYKYAEIERDENGAPKTVKAIISVTDGVTVDTVEPTIEVTETGGTSKAINFFNDEKRMRLTGISGDEEKIRIEILPSIETLSSMPITATITTKPFIWLLWLSVVAMVAGTLLSAFKSSTKSN